MKRKFKITIEGESYEVEVEEIEETGTKVPPSPAKSPPITPEAPPAPLRASSSSVTKPPPARVSAEEVITSPMPGTITAIRVKAGDEVKAGDVLLILESMKIENEILAPWDGKIREVFVAVGKYVRRREPLVAIEG